MSTIRPVNWNKPRTDIAERIIRKRAENTANIIIGIHAFERVEEREIVQADVYKILRNGYVDEVTLEPDGEWKAVVTLRLKGSREAGVVTIIFVDENTLFVKTVEWMDMI
jgi:hypothetical protein